MTSRPSCTTCRHAVYRAGLECHHPLMRDPFDGSASLASIERRSGWKPCGPPGQLWEPRPPFWSDRKKTIASIVIFLVLAILYAVIS